MALVKCKECGHEVSTQAEKCPNCGAPGPKKQAEEKATVIAMMAILAIGVVVYVTSCSGSGDKPTASNEPAKSEEQCKADDLQCLGNKGVIAAGIYCKDKVERLANYSVKWTDGTFEMKFSHFRWQDKANGVITYIGDKAAFQNGFGAFAPVVYECDLASDGKTVLDVRATEGRLP